jgi:hypothetical protein
MLVAGFKKTGLGIVTTVSWLCASYAVAADTPTPVKIAVFPFELEDHSPASKGGESPHLAQSTGEAKKQLAGTGRYAIVDTASADMSVAKGQPLRDCGGCEVAIARVLGADQAMIGVISKISNTEYLVKLQVSDARSGKVLSQLTSELRMGADYSWSRGVRSLIQNQLLPLSSGPPPPPPPPPPQPPGD